MYFTEFNFISNSINICKSNFNCETQAHIVQTSKCYVRKIKIKITVRKGKKLCAKQQKNGAHRSMCAFMFIFIYNVELFYSRKNWI